MTPDEALDALADATTALTQDIASLTDAEVGQASLLPGWSRAHVLAHLAQNAEGGARLLSWAETGEPSFEYASMADRDRNIEMGSRQPAARLIAAVQRSADAFAQAASRLPGDRWQALVRYTNGSKHPAEVIVSSRLAEVLFHHVDLDLRYAPQDWPLWFVRERLTRVTSSLTARGLVAAPARLTAGDTGLSWDLGAIESPTRPTISGAECDLLAWLYGRTDGRRLARDPAGSLPVIPPIY